MGEWIIEPYNVLPIATALMRYYRDHPTGAAKTYYEAFKRAQAYLAIMQDQGAQILSTDKEAWLPSQRDPSKGHTVSREGCDCEAGAFNRYCVHRAAYDCIRAVYNGEEVRRI